MMLRAMLAYMTELRELPRFPMLAVAAKSITKDVTRFLHGDG